MTNSSAKKVGPNLEPRSTVSLSMFIYVVFQFLQPQTSFCSPLPGCIIFHITPLLLQSSIPLSWLPSPLTVAGCLQVCSNSPLAQAIHWCLIHWRLLIYASVRPFLSKPIPHFYRSVVYYFYIVSTKWPIHLLRNQLAGQVSHSFVWVRYSKLSRHMS